MLLYDPAGWKNKKSQQFFSVLVVLYFIFLYKFETLANLNKCTYQSNVRKKEKGDGKVILEHGFSVSGKIESFLYP